MSQSKSFFNFSYAQNDICLIELRNYESSNISNCYDNLRTGLLDVIDFGIRSYKQWILLLHLAIEDRLW